jgi:regulator of RNase E activity RraA
MGFHRAYDYGILRTVTRHKILLHLRNNLFTAVVGDVMDAMGLTRQFLPAEVKPLNPDVVLAGIAMPVLEADCASEQVAHANQTRPFGLMFEALDSLKEDEIYLATGASLDYALWGELMSTRAMHLKAAGAIVNGYSRDTKGILSLDFPVFSRGTYAQDQRVRGRIIDYNCPVSFPNGLTVHPGDYLFGDCDGVLAIPQDRAVEVVEGALEKVNGENLVAQAIRQGMSTTEAWDTFGIM